MNYVYARSNRVKGNIVCRKVNNSWEIYMTNINGPRVARLLGRNYTADTEALPLSEREYAIILQNHGVKLVS